MTSLRDVDVTRTKLVKERDELLRAVRVLDEKIAALTPRKKYSKLASLRKTDDRLVKLIESAKTEGVRLDAICTSLPTVKRSVLKTRLWKLSRLGDVTCRNNRYYVVEHAPERKPLAIDVAIEMIAAAKTSLGFPEITAGLRLQGVKFDYTNLRASLDRRERIGEIKIINDLYQMA